MPDDIGTIFVANKVNGAALLVMQKENFKDIGMEAGPLDLLQREIPSLCAEAIFVDHSTYCFRKILD